MPTIKQLYESMRARDYFEPHQEGYNVRGSSMAGSGNAPLPEFTGKGIECVPPMKDWEGRSDTLRTDKAEGEDYSKP